MRITLVLRPELSFAQLSEALPALGWFREPESLASPPILSGEPELASWAAENGTERAVYTFNPVVALRVLAFHGPHAQKLASAAAGALPTLGKGDVLGLLNSPDPRQLLLGIFAAGEMNLISAREDLERLRVNGELSVARAAAAAQSRLSQAAMEPGAARLVPEKERRPDRSVLFSRLGDAQFRRQTLRWLIQDRVAVNNDVVGVLRSALEDPDWEVRTTAMLAAARLRVEALARAVRDVRLPTTSREGLDEPDRKLLRAMRKAAALILAGAAAVPDEPPGTPATRSDWQRHLLRCVAGAPIATHDRIFLLTHALTEPVHEDPPPTKPPAGVILTGTALRLARTGIEIAWVPPVPHWLGEDPGAGELPNPIRQVTLARGFFIAIFPLTQSTLRQIGVPDAAHAPGHNDYIACSFEEARDICQVLSQLEGLTVRLPTAEEWEMAVRGPDGRRHPWGNGLERDMLGIASPYGCRDAVGGIGQWVTGSGGKPVLCGVSKFLKCAAQMPALAGEKAGVRIVLGT